MKPVRISFDIGGVISRQPSIWRPIIQALMASPNVEVYALTDMHEHPKAVAMLHMNDIMIPAERVIVSNFTEHQGLCKAVKLQELEIDVHVDDFPDYVAEGAPVRLLLMPTPRDDYYHPEWKTDGTEGNFGRRSQRQCQR